MKTLKLNNITPRVSFIKDKTNTCKTVRYIEATSSDFITKHEKSSLSVNLRNVWNCIRENFKYNK